MLNMKKTGGALCLLLVLSALSLYVSSATCPEQCAVSDVTVSGTTRGLEDMDVLINGVNSGSREGGCRYSASLHDNSGKELDRGPFAYNPLYVLGFGTTLPGEDFGITLSSGMWRWNLCDLFAFPGTGEYFVKIRAFNHEGVDCVVYQSDIIQVKIPDSCCGPAEGLYCFDYGTNAWGLECSDLNDVQVNQDVGCLTFCQYDPNVLSCSCALVSPCAIECTSTGRISKCKYDYFVCDGKYYQCAVPGDVPGTENEIRCSTTINCQYQCAAGCGKATDCKGNCEECCRTRTCAKNDPVYGKDEMSVCMDGCVGLCKANEELCNLIQMLQGIAAGVATIVILVQGIKWILSDDPEGRTDAKWGIIYAMCGLLFVVLSSVIASYLLIGTFTC